MRSRSQPPPASAPTPCPPRLHVGGLSKLDLLARLVGQHVRLNPLAMDLFASPYFQTLHEPVELRAEVRTVAELGGAQGATMPELLAAAAGQGLRACPLEAGPQLRLQWMTQGEGFVGHPATRGRAPPMSLTVVSLPLDPDGGLPAGFYLRCIDGAPWLRGYRSDDEHLWSPTDTLLFCS